MPILPVAPTRILLADDHASFRAVLREMLEKERDIQVIGEVGDGIELLESLSSNIFQAIPDVIILDVQMRRMGGMEAAKRVTQIEPAIRLLALSMHDDAQFVLAMIAAGVSGYILKDDPWPTLLGAIRSVAAGKPCFSPALNYR